MQSPQNIKDKLMKYTLLTVTEAITEAVDTTVQEPEVFDSFWDYIYKTFIDPMEYYDHLNIGSGTLLSVRMIIIGLFIGIALACFAAVFNKRVLGALVRTIIKKECLSPEKAMTLDELGYDNIIMRWAVKHSTSLRRVVKCVQEEEHDAQIDKKRLEHEENKKKDRSLPKFKETSYKINDLTDTFYIHEDMKYMADTKFEQKGTSLPGAIIMVLVLLIAMFVLLGFLPNILNLINDVAGSLDNTGNNIL